MRKLTLFIVLIGLLAFGGTALALMDGENSYTGCLNGGGNINKVAIGDEPLLPCEDDQTQISWNAEGPPGPPGEPGLSQGYVTAKGDMDITLDPGEDPVDVMSLDLTAGSYISTITIHASYYPDGLYPKDEHAFISCFVEANDANISGDFGTTLQGTETTAFTFGFDLDEDSDVITKCYVGHIDDESESITINRGNWTAVQVDILNRQ